MSLTPATLQNVYSIHPPSVSHLIPFLYQEGRFEECFAWLHLDGITPFDTPPISSFHTQTPSHLLSQILQSFRIDHFQRLLNETSYHFSNSSFCTYFYSCLRQLLEAHCRLDSPDPLSPDLALFLTQLTELIPSDHIIQDSFTIENLLSINLFCFYRHPKLFELTSRIFEYSKTHRPANLEPIKGHHQTHWMSYLTGSIKQNNPHIATMPYEQFLHQLQLIPSVQVSFTLDRSSQSRSFNLGSSLFDFLIECHYKQVLDSDSKPSPIASGLLKDIRGRISMPNRSDSYSTFDSVKDYSPESAPLHFHYFERSCLFYIQSYLASQKNPSTASSIPSPEIFFDHLQSQLSQYPFEINSLTNFFSSLPPSFFLSLFTPLAQHLRYYHSSSNSHSFLLDFDHALSSLIKNITAVCPDHPVFSHSFSIQEDPITQVSSHTRIIWDRSSARTFDFFSLLLHYGCFETLNSLPQLDHRKTSLQFSQFYSKPPAQFGVSSILPNHFLLASTFIEERTLRLKLNSSNPPSSPPQPLKRL